MHQYIISNIKQGAAGYAGTWIHGICRNMDPWDMQEHGFVGYAGTWLRGICRKIDPRDMKEDGSVGYAGR